MNRLNRPSDIVARRVRETLVQEKRRRPITGAAARSAAMRAAQATNLVGRGASNLAREAVEGAVRSVTEIGGETREFVKDTVIGVVEGTGQVVAITAPAVREVVVGAVRGSSDTGADVGEVSRNAVEGAIVGASSAGIDAMEAASAAVDGAVEAVVEAGGDMGDAAKATVGGAVSGVASVGGDAAAAARDAGYRLISHDALADRDPDEIAQAAGAAIEVALQEAEGANVETDAVVAATATGIVEAAYRVGETHGDKVRRSVLRRVIEPRLAIAPDMERRLAEVAETLSEELPRGRAAWRGASLVNAARLLFQVGGMDLAGSLAYFTILSILPMAALAIMAVSVFGDPEGVGDGLAEALAYYFPASRDLIQEAVGNLLGGSLTLGLAAAVSIAFGATGLFMAANRAVNRIFGTERTKITEMTMTQITLATLVGVLFFLSVSLTAFLQSVVNLDVWISDSPGVASIIMAVSFEIVSVALHSILTAIIFAFVYRHLPNTRVDWRDATFGAMVVVALFEVVKHIFLWFTGLSAQRTAVYGPIASVVVLMMWGYIGGLIFLYGAAIAKVAGEMRPADAS